MSEILRLDQFNREEIFEGMIRNGAASVPLISEGFRQVLFQEAKRKQSLPGVSGVEFRGVGGIDLFNQTRVALNELVKDRFKDCLDKGFSFTDVGLNTYRFLGSIEPHADPYHGLICIVVIDGRARFYSSPTGDYADFYQTRRQIPNKGGDVIFMRAYGFPETRRNILHQVGHVMSLRRDTLVLRWDTNW